MDEKGINSLQGLLNFKTTSLESSEQLVEYKDDFNSKGYPVMFNAKSNFISLDHWIKNNKNTVKEKLSIHGAILFRNFNMTSIDSFRDVVKTFENKPMEYTLGAAKRSKIIDNIYLSTHHPADENLQLHNEMSYSDDWPNYIVFYCNTAPFAGGETPIADNRRVWELLDPRTKKKFIEKGVLYVRQVGGLLGGITWQELFKTKDKSLVEADCGKHNIKFEWIGKDVLKMKWILPATKIHPITLQTSWFNHVFFFNAIMLNKDILGTLDPTDMPFISYYGDGSVIDEVDLIDIGDAFEKTKTCFEWKKGDLLLIDNISISHGRNPYKGEREILVAMFKDID
jgi:hypothetical protein